jgi:hypothetical protein
VSAVSGTTPAARAGPQPVTASPLVCMPAALTLAVVDTNFTLGRACHGACHWHKRTNTAHLAACYLSKLYLLAEEIGLPLRTVERYLRRLASIGAVTVEVGYQRRPGLPPVTRRLILPGFAYARL